MDIESIDVESLRNDLINYYGTSSVVNEANLLIVDRLKNASDEDIINLAINNDIDLDKYSSNRRL